MSKIRIEIDDDTDIAAQLRAAGDKALTEQRAYKERYDALSVEERKGMPRPLLDSVEDVYERAFHLGASAIGHGDRAPNAIVVLNEKLDPEHPGHQRIYKKGQIVTVFTTLPIGAEVIVLETSKEDGPNWFVQNLTFGAMNLMCAWYGHGECAPLSTFRRVTCNDLLSVFARTKTKVDVQVCATLICKKDGTTFDGIRILIALEEMHCAIDARLENIPCEHPESHVTPLKYVDAPYPLYSYVHYVPQHQHLAPVIMGGTGLIPATTIPATTQRYFCSKCKRAVMKIEDVHSPASTPSLNERP
jgi:ribosomal protein S27E